MNLPKVGLDLPKVGMDLPIVQDLPKVGLDLPKVGMDLPIVQDLPKVGMDLPILQDLPKIEIGNKVKGLFGPPAQKLKHLELVRVVAISTLVCLLNLYDYAKERSGPLKSIVGALESVVTAILGPVYQKFKDVATDLLVFADNKVDKVSIKFDEYAPSPVKKVVHPAQSILDKATKVVENLMQEAKAGGPSAVVHYARSLLKDFAVSQSINLWFQINKVIPLREVVVMALPTVIRLSDKYNNTVVDMSAKGFIVFRYFPLIPFVELGKAYLLAEAAKKAVVGAVEAKLDLNRFD